MATPLIDRIMREQAGQQAGEPTPTVFPEPEPAAAAPPAPAAPMAAPSPEPMPEPAAPIAPGAPSLRYEPTPQVSMRNLEDEKRLLLSEFRAEQSKRSKKVSGLKATRSYKMALNKLARFNEQWGPPIAYRHTPSGMVEQEGYEEEDWNWPEVDRVLASAYERYPAWRRENGGFLKHGSMSPKARQQHREREESFLMKVGHIIGLPARFWVSTAAVAAGAEKTDVLLSTWGGSPGYVSMPRPAPGHELPGVALAQEAPWLVDAVAENVLGLPRIETAEDGSWEITNRPKDATDMVNRKEMATAIIALGAELVIDPLIVIGFGAPGRTSQAMRQVGRAVAEAPTETGKIGTKVAKEAIRRTEKTATAERMEALRAATGVGAEGEVAERSVDAMRRMAADVGNPNIADDAEALLGSAAEALEATKAAAATAPATAAKAEKVYMLPKKQHVEAVEFEKDLLSLSEAMTGIREGLPAATTSDEIFAVVDVALRQRRRSNTLKMMDAVTHEAGNVATLIAKSLLKVEAKALKPTRKGEKLAKVTLGEFRPAKVVETLEAAGRGELIAPYLARVRGISEELYQQATHILPTVGKGGLVKKTPAEILASAKAVLAEGQAAMRADDALEEAGRLLGSSESLDVLSAAPVEALSALKELNKLANNPLGDLSKQLDSAIKHGPQAEGTAKLLTGEAADIAEVVMREARQIFAKADSLEEARDPLVKMLRKHLGDESADYLMNKVGASFGRAGLVGTMPFAGITVTGTGREAVLELVPRHLFREGKEWGLATGNYMRRHMIRKWTRATGGKLNAAIYNTWGARLHERLKGSFVVGFKQSLIRHLDQSSDWAATRFLDDVFEEPIEATTRVPDLERAADLPLEAGVKVPLKKEPAGTSQFHATVLQEHRAELSGILADAIMTTGYWRRHALRAFEKRYKQLQPSIQANLEGRAREIAKLDPERFPDVEAAARMAREKGDWSTLVDDIGQLEQGKWPERMSEKLGFDDPRRAAFNLDYENAQVKQLLSQYTSVLDEMIRATIKQGSRMSGKYRTEKVRKEAGKRWADMQQKFIDEAPSEVIEAFGRERVEEMQELVSWAMTEVNAVVSRELELGMDIAKADEYWTSVIENIDALIPELGEKMKDVISGIAKPTAEKQLTLAQQTAMQLSPEVDIVKMVMARRIVHARITQSHILKGELARKFGRPVKSVGDVRRMTERYMKDKAGKRVLVDEPMEVIEASAGKTADGDDIVQLYAVPKYALEAVEEALGLIDGTNTKGVAFIRNSNAFLRSVYTAPNPGFHIRNELSSMLMSFLTGGVRSATPVALSYFAAMLPATVKDSVAIAKWPQHIKNPRLRAHAQEYAERMQAMGERIGNITFTQRGTGRKVTLREAADWAREDGAINKGWFSYDAKLALDEEVKMATSGPLAKLARANAASIAGAAAGGIAGVTGTETGAGGFAGAFLGGAVGQLFGKSTVLMKMGRRSGEYVENHNRLAVYIDQLRKGASRGEARHMADKAHYAYKIMTPFERGTMRETFLFYGWLRNNLPQMIENTLTRPARLGAFFKGKRAVEYYAGKTTWSDITDEQLPRYYRRMWAMKLPVKSGKGTRVALAFDFPFRDLNLLSPEREDFFDNVLGALTPIYETPINALMHAINEAPIIFGQAGRKLSGRLVPLPRWLEEGLPSSAKKTIGVRVGREVAVTHRAKIKDFVLTREYVDERTLYFINEIPWFLRLSKWPEPSLDAEGRKRMGLPETLLSEDERAQFARYAFLAGVRMYPFDEKEEAFREAHKRRREATKVLRQTGHGRGVKPGRPGE